MLERDPYNLQQLIKYFDIKTLKILLEIMPDTFFETDDNIYYFVVDVLKYASLEILQYLLSINIFRKVIEANLNNLIARNAQRYYVEEKINLLFSEFPQKEFSMGSLISFFSYEESDKENETTFLLL